MLWIKNNSTESKITSNIIITPITIIWHFKLQQPHAQQSFALSLSEYFIVSSEEDDYYSDEEDDDEDSSFFKSFSFSPSLIFI